MAGPVHTVMIVDDEPSFRILVRKALESVQIRVIEAAGVAEALALALTQVPHLVIVDLNLPTESGLDLLRAKPDHPVLRNVPVMVMSAIREKETVFTAIGLGATDYVVKPIQISLFLQKIRRVLRDRRFLSRSIDSQEKAKARFTAMLTDITPTHVTIESPLKIAPDTQVEIHAPILRQNELHHCVFVSTESKIHRTENATFVTELNVVGLREALTRKLRKAVET